MILWKRLQKTDEYINENKELKNKIQNLEKQIDSLIADLEKIKSAKFYKLWQKYCKIRDYLLKRIKLN